MSEIRADEAAYFVCAMNDTRRPATNDHVTWEVVEVSASCPCARRPGYTSCSFATCGMNFDVFRVGIYDAAG